MLPASNVLPLRVASSNAKISYPTWKNNQATTNDDLTPRRDSLHNDHHARTAHTSLPMFLLIGMLGLGALGTLSYITHQLARGKPNVGIPEILAGGKKRARYFPRAK